MIDYEELRIRAFKTGTDRYLLFANGPAAAAAVVTLGRQAGEYWRELSGLFREEFAGGPADGAEPTAERARRLGRELFQTLFPEPILGCFQQCLELARRDERSLRLRFEVDPELMDLPFEILSSPAGDVHGDLALQSSLSVVRSLPGQPHNPLRLPQPGEDRQPVSLVLVASSPKGLPPLLADREIERIYQALPPILKTKELPPIQVLGSARRGRSRATLRNLQNLLQKQRTAPCLVVLIAHGAWDESQKENVVFLESEDGLPEPVPGKILSNALTKAPGLRLAVLNLCLGTRSAPGEPFSGLAQSLIAGGVPAVVAMQMEVSDTAASVFSPALLEAICRNCTIDEAVSAGRIAAQRRENRLEWANPVLFFHRDCGQGWLFKVSEAQAGLELPDPLREGQLALDRFDETHDLRDIPAAAFLLKQGRNWGRVAKLADVGLDVAPAPAFERLSAEAAAEARARDLAGFCEQLAHGREIRALGRDLARLRQSLPAQIFEVLSREFDEAAEVLQRCGEALHCVSAAGKDPRRAWTGAIEHYERILELRPSGHGDVRRRLKTARRELVMATLRGDAGAALEAGDWEQALVRARAVLALCPEDQGALQAAAYATGCIADREERREEALQAYGSLLAGLRQDETGYLDTREREARTRAREAEARARAAEREERRARAVAAFEDLAALGLAADPCAASRRLHSYAALREAGIHPNAPAEAVKDASFTLMEKGAMTPEARRAWDQLRSPAGRLRVDACLYRLEAPEALRRALQQLALEPSEDLAAALGQASPGDAPLFLLLAGRRDEAIAAWEKLLAEDPDRTEAAHGLALATSFQARELEEDGAGEAAEAAWEKALAAWTAVLSDDAYWEAWRRERAERYQQPVTPADVARLRGELGQQLLQDLSGGDERSRALTLALEIELEGARLLRETGGLPLDESGGRPLVCGPLYLLHHALGPQLHRKIAELEAADDGRERESILTSLDAALGIGDSAGGDRGLDPGISPITLFRLRCVFSGLGRPLLLLDRCQPELALRALPPLDTGRRAEHQDAVELAVRAHLALARDALEAGVLAAAVRRWREAIEVSRRSNSQGRTKRAIARAVLGRARPLAQGHGRRRGECLTAAIELVEQARRLVGADEGQLRDFAAKVYTERGIWRGTGCAEWEDPDYEKAAQDLRIAVQLAPEDLHARDNLSRALIFGADGSQDPLKLLAEAVEVLHEGLCRTAGNGQLVHMLHRGLDELENCFLNEEELARRIARPDGDRPADGPGDAEEARRMVAAAERRRARGDEPGEIKALVAAVRQNSADPAIRLSLLEAVQRQAGLAG